ncbi:MAG: TraR/DksA C4-type zinc finger protein [Ignavibacteriales bacterium]|nr:TraR/DksA C4-type zinc finger protein [Ignavibacteriales bacterium]
MAKKAAAPKKKAAVKKAAKKPVKKAAPKAAVKKAAVKPKAAAAAKPAPKPKGYNVKDVETFKNIILEKRKEILDELQLLKESMMDVTTGEYATENSTYSMHMEQGTDAMEREKTFLFASREGKFLNYLEDALKRIEKGTYGFCTDCGKLIEKERLEAVPHAQLCVRCKLKKGR